MKKEDLRLDTLFSQVLTYRKTEHFHSFMHRIAGLTKLSPYNAMLVYMQCPGAGEVATASQWKALGAEIKEGANPLVILRPFGPVEFVFEESDIVPETKPKGLESIFEIKKGDISKTELYHLVDNLKGRGINVNCITPGPYPSPEVQKDEEFIRRLSKKNPAGRIGQPEDLKGAVLLLSSAASDYIVGQNIIVDGGWML